MLKLTVKKLVKKGSFSEVKITPKRVQSTSIFGFSSNTVLYLDLGVEITHLKG